jgi:dTDP-glucose 4,6-dehydratase
VCAILDELRPNSLITHYSSLITYVKDRPGHDHRYAINAEKIRRELGWEPQERFEKGLSKTVEWYLTHDDWIQNVVSGDYRKWVDLNYSARQ